MYKRVAVVAAALVFALTLVACGDGEEAFSSMEATARPPAKIDLPKSEEPKTKPLPTAPDALPKVDGRAFNVEGWASQNLGGTRSYREAFIYTKQGPINEPGAVHFIDASKGLRIKLRPGARVVGVEVVYAKPEPFWPTGSIEKKSSWDGKTPVPWGKRFITKSGEQSWEELSEVSVWIYDPHFPHPEPAARSAHQT